MHPISADIEEEFAQISREAEHLSKRLERLDAGKALSPGSQDEWEAVTLCASASEKIYTGCERVMSRIANEVDGAKIDKVENWHRALLDRMTAPFRGRAAIIAPETRALLDRMRAFRHRERNSYGFRLDAPIVLERAHEAILAFHALTADIHRFLESHPGDTPKD